MRSMMAVFSGPLGLPVLVGAKENHVAIGVGAARRG